MSIKYILNELADFYMESDVYKRNLFLGILKDKFEFDLKGTKFEYTYGLYNLKGYIYLDKLNKIDNSNSFSYLRAICDVGFLNYIGLKNIKCNFISNNMDLDSIYTLNKGYNFDVDLYKYSGKFKYVGNDLDFLKHLCKNNINKLYLGDKTSVYNLYESDVNNFNTLELKERLDIINTRCIIPFKEAKLCFKYQNIDIDDIEIIKQDIVKVLNDGSKSIKSNEIQLKFYTRVYINFEFISDYFNYIENIKDFVSFLMVYLKPYFNLNKSLRLYIYNHKRHCYIEVLKDTFFVLREPINWT